MELKIIFTATELSSTSHTLSGKSFTHKNAPSPQFAIYGENGETLLVTHLPVTLIHTGPNEFTVYIH